MSIDQLNEDYSARLASIAKARQESPEQVFAKFGKDGILKAPRKITPHFQAIRNTVFEDAGVRDGMAYVKMPNGRIFYGHLSENNHRKQYAFTHDLISPKISEDTYLLALDVAHRYAKELSWPCQDVLPDEGGSVVECGAFVGHKSIRFIDEVIGKSGKLLAIELMPDNVEILQRNIEENGMKDCIDVIHAGIWSEPGKMTVKGKGRQRNSLVELKYLEEDQDIEVRVDSLANLLNEWDQPIVDLIYMTINGAEVEGVKGSIPAFNRIRNYFVVAPYKPDGVPNSDTCRQIFKDNGCELLPTAHKSHVMASMPK